MSKGLNWIRLDGTNEIECELPFFIELTDQLAIGHLIYFRLVNFRKKFRHISLYYYENKSYYFWSWGFRT